jgi:hypothetical protein
MVTNGNGTATANVTSVQVSCTTTSTTQNEWTWMIGASEVNQAGNYGIKGDRASNVPGARVNSAAWVDAAGNFWLFGGGIRFRRKRAKRESQ